jgi:Cof subfamily protein (haloacid dehalogenase superfamily)
MSQVKLIATDLDGTLLDSTGKIPERNIEVIREAIARGVAMTICTGRMFSSARRFAEQLAIKKPLICYNGAMARGIGEDPLWHLTLALPIAKKLLSVCRERGVHVQSYMDDDVYVSDANDPAFKEYSAHFGVTGRVIGNALYSPTTSPTKLLAMTEKAEDAAALALDLQRQFGDEIYITRSNMNFVEMMNPNVNKAAGLAKLAGIMGFTMDEVLAIGDGENDVEMVGSAGVGVAMGNGAPKIRGAAKHVAPTNDENGVSWAVERFVLFV